MQDVKVPSGSGVFAYADSNDFDSVAANRSIAWRTFDDVLELQEYSLNRNLNGSLLKFQFKNTLILQNGVSVHETTDRVYILVTTLVSAHRLIFRHPNKLVCALAYLCQVFVEFMMFFLLEFKIKSSEYLDQNIGRIARLFHFSS